MSSSRNEAELMAFMEAVVNEECKNAFTSNDHERPTVWRSGRQNSIDCPIILQNVYYASKEDPRQPFLCTNRGETEDSNHSSEPETTVSRKTTSVGVFSAKPLQENESASEYDKLQESYGCNPWCKVKLSVENPNDESTVTCYHLHGRPNTITIVRGLTDLQSNADSELHQFHVHPKSLTSPPTKLGRYFQPHPDSKEWIGNACLWRTMNGFTEEVQVAEGKNSDVPQSEYHANQSQFTVSQTWCEGSTSPYASNHSSAANPSRPLLSAKTTSPRLDIQFILDSEDNPPDKQERPFKLPSPTRLYSDGRDCGADVFTRENMNSLHEEECIFTSRFTSNPNDNHSPPIENQHAVSRKRGGARNTSVLSEEALIKRALITVEKSTSLWRGIDSPIHDTATDEAKQMKLNNADQGQAVTKTHTLFTKEVQATSFPLAYQDSESVVKKSQKMASLSSMPTSNRGVCSSKRCFPQIASVSKKSKTKENLHTGPKRLVHKRTMAPASSTILPKEGTVTKTPNTGFPVSQKHPHSLTTDVSKYGFKGFSRRLSKRCYLTCHYGIQTEEKQFICPWKCCGRRFKRGDERARHYRSHTGEKPYQCPSCARPFARSDHLKNHMRKIHFIND